MHEKNRQEVHVSSLLRRFHVFLRVCFFGFYEEHKLVKPVNGVSRCVNLVGFSGGFFFLCYLFNLVGSVSNYVLFVRWKGISFLRFFPKGGKRKEKQRLGRVSSFSSDFYWFRALRAMRARLWDSASFRIRFSVDDS